MITFLRRRWHQIRGRHPWKYEAPLTVEDRTYGPFLLCKPCNKALLLQAEPPFEHPDSMTVELPREQEEWLAAVDRELWAKEAA